MMDVVVGRLRPRPRPFPCSHRPRPTRLLVPPLPHLHHRRSAGPPPLFPVPVRPYFTLQAHYANNNYPGDGAEETPSSPSAAKGKGIGFAIACSSLLAVAYAVARLRMRNPIPLASVAEGLGLGPGFGGGPVVGPKLMQVLHVLRGQGLILAALLGLSAFFSMAETSITTLWPWKVRELADKDPENGVFRMLRSDITRFLTTILIGTTVVNIGATALVTEAATEIFGEVGVSAATGVMTVAILLLTEITPKSIAVHNATEVARFVVRPVAWLSLVLYPVGRITTFLSMGLLKLLGLKGRSEPYVTEDELKLMLRGAELSGAIEEEEQDMIENVLEIKDIHVREVMTPLVDVVAIDASAKLMDFLKLWERHRYSRVPVFEGRIDNIVGVAYAMDMLEHAEKADKLTGSFVREIARMPIYFVPDSMSVWSLLREFRIRKVHMAVILNEYGGTIGIATLEDVVEEIVGEIFDENDSKEEIERKTGYIVMREDGIFDVDANTCIDQLSEGLNIKIPEGHQYETVSGFICESFGYIPKEGEKIVVGLERIKRENYKYTARATKHQAEKENHQMFELEILEANERKVGKVLFKPSSSESLDLKTNGINRKANAKLVKRKKKIENELDNGHQIASLEGNSASEILVQGIVDNNSEASPSDEQSSDKSVYVDDYI